MTRIVFISDTHNQHDIVQVPDCDILVHCGDATTTGTRTEMAKFAQWWDKQPGKHKVFVPGNHDLLFRDEPELASALFPRTHVELHGELELEGLRFFLSSYTPEYGKHWAFHYERNGPEAANFWAPLWSGEDYDVVVTHGPPLGILDKCSERWGNKSAGCRQLLDAVLALAPFVHAFGHIHHGYGTYHLSPQDANDTVFINAALNTDDYELMNAPWVVDVVNGVVSVAPPVR